MRTLHKPHKKNLRLAEEDHLYGEHSTRTRFRGKRHYRQTSKDVFKCKRCRRFIGPLPFGGHHRNHCPFCLSSRHVDEWSSGDRLSGCGSVMEPIGSFQRPKGEHVIVHRCLGCGFERFNRIAADDDFELVLALPVLPPRTSREMKALRWEIELALYETRE